MESPSEEGRKRKIVKCCVGEEEEELKQRDKLKRRTVGYGEKREEFEYKQVR